MIHDIFYLLFFIELLFCADVGIFIAINTYKGQGQLIHTLIHTLFSYLLKRF